MRSEVHGKDINKIQSQNRCKIHYTKIVNVDTFLFHSCLIDKEELMNILYKVRLLWSETTLILINTLQTFSLKILNAFASINR
jgi:hypothetical protein